MILPVRAVIFHSQIQPKKNTSLGDDAIYDVQVGIEKKNEGQSGKMSKLPSRDTVIRTASASVVIDVDAVEIHDDELRVTSLAR